MMTRLLVANRGEIARRVFHTCREMGIETVAVFTPVDTGSLHVTEADLAVAVYSYLDSDGLVRAAVEAGADAVHPGYGFLSENAAFARAVIEAGLTWVGPPPEAIEAMGSKLEAKKLMADAGVPVLSSSLPSSAGEFPVVVKASAGGGGRGMRVVHSADALEQALVSARSEAEAAFGDPAVFCEPYLDPVRHIEIQVVADQHGRVWTLGERECSLQRRHQKVVEESPSPLVTPSLREALCDAARSAAEAIGYVGAGTIEFLVGPDGRFFFLEMNTRLQVEHPVTECVTGLDLVRLQIAVAGGEPLGDPPSLRGHAIEVRLYAEDPAREWLPQSGVLRRFEVPGVDASFTPLSRPGLRLDSGVATGSVVSVHYDPMLAKLIAWAPTRAEAARRLASALAAARIHGLRTNRDLLVRVLRHPGFLAGNTTTAFLTRPGTAPHSPATAGHLLGVRAGAAPGVPAAQDPNDFREMAAMGGHDPSHFPENARILGEEGAGGVRHVRILPERPELFEPLADEEGVRLSAVAAARAVAAAHRASAKVLRGLPSGWRNVRSAPRRRFDVDYEPHPDDTPEYIVIDTASRRYTFSVAIYEDAVEVDSILGPVSLPRVPRFPVPEAEIKAGSLVAPMPGTVVRIAVQVGQRVEPGEPLLWLEAMKMEHRLDAPSAGTVAAINATVNQQVEVGTVLVVIEEQP